MLDRLGVRYDFLIEELAGRARDGAVLLGEVFGREDVGGRGIGDQESPAGRRPGGSHYCRHSRIPAAPCPPPTHMVTIPYFALRRGISRRMVAVSLAPVQPSGWPRAMAPPLTLVMVSS